MLIAARMKKNNHDRKLRLDATTVRSLTPEAFDFVVGGKVSSVGTCTGCRPSACGDECQPTYAIRGQICV